MLRADATRPPAGLAVRGNFAREQHGHGHPGIPALAIASRTTASSAVNESMGNYANGTIPGVGDAAAIRWPAVSSADPLPIVAAARSIA
jgi:hypothetical protein